MEPIEIIRTENILIEIEEEDKITSHLIEFKFITTITTTKKEIIIDGEIYQTTYETQYYLLD